jgi:hypothetical protein
MLGIVGFGLSACTPGSPTATRVNADGSISFVSCYTIEDVDYVSAVTEVRSGFPAKIDESKTVDMTSLQPVAEILEGEVYTFQPVTDDWTEANFFFARSGHESVAARAERSHTIDEWVWNTDV